MTRWTPELEARWRELGEEVLTGLKEWRLQHPKATLREIEAAIDDRLGKVRARMLEDTALLSAAAAVSNAVGAERSRCPSCGQPLEARGLEVRELTTTGNQTIRLSRSSAVCPSCGEGLFPPG